MVVNWKKNVREKNLKERRGREREWRSFVKFYWKVPDKISVRGVLISTSCTRTEIKKLTYRSICSLVVHFS